MFRYAMLAVHQYGIVIIIQIQFNKGLDAVINMFMPGKGPCIKDVHHFRGEGGLKLWTLFGKILIFL